MGPALTVHARVDADPAEAAFKASRRELNSATRKALIRAAERVALPRVRLLAPSVIRSYLTARATTTRAYITVRGPRKFDRIAGLLNYGGIVTTKLRPVEAKALIVAPGIYRAAVNRPRRYKGKHYIEKGVDASMPAMENAVRDEMLEAFDGFRKIG